MEEIRLYASSYGSRGASAAPTLGLVDSEGGGQPLSSPYKPVLVATGAVMVKWLKWLNRRRRNKIRQLNGRKMLRIADESEHAKLYSRTTLLANSKTNSCSFVSRDQDLHSPFLIFHVGVGIGVGIA